MDNTQFLAGLLECGDHVIERECAVRRHACFTLGKEKGLLIAGKREVVFAEPSFLVPILEHINRLHEDRIRPWNLAF